MTTKKKKSAWPRAIISDKVRDHSNDPFVLKKGKESREFLEKHGFPKDMKK